MESGLRCTLEGPGNWSRHIAGIQVFDSTGTAVTSQIQTGGWEDPEGDIVSIPNLRPGTYFVHVEPGSDQPWLPMWYEQADSVSRATPIVISTPGEVVPVLFRLIARNR